MIDEKNLALAKGITKQIAHMGVSFCMGAVAGPVVAAYTGIAHIAAAISVPVATSAIGWGLKKQCDTNVDEMVESAVKKVNTLETAIEKAKQKN